MIGESNLAEQVAAIRQRKEDEPDYDYLDTGRARSRPTTRDSGASNFQGPRKSVSQRSMPAQQSKRPEGGGGGGGAKVGVVKSGFTFG